MAQIEISGYKDDVLKKANAAQCFKIFITEKLNNKGEGLAKSEEELKLEIQKLRKECLKL